MEVVWHHDEGDRVNEFAILGVFELMNHKSPNPLVFKHPDAMSCCASDQINAADLTESAFTQAPSLEMGHSIVSI